jgi:hypothetical protein
VEANPIPGVETGFVATVFEDTKIDLEKQA